jgi:hypothetical protein
VDLNIPHPDLKVELSLQSPIAFKDTSERDEVLATLMRTYLSKRTEGSTPLLFTILPEHFDFSINYVPTHHVTCVTPHEPRLSAPSPPPPASSHASGSLAPRPLISP